MMPPPHRHHAPGRIALPLTTERPLLREFVSDDLDAVRAYTGDPEVARFMFYEPRDVDAASAYLQQVLASQQQTPRRVWEVAIVEQHGQRLIGACDLTLEGEREADLGYSLARNAWGHGYAAEAARALLQVGFEHLDLERIFAVCAVENRRSARVLEKIGLRYEGIVAGYRFAKGRWWDVDRYALTRTEWVERWAR